MDNFTKIKNKELMKLKKMVENFKNNNNIIACEYNENIFNDKNSEIIV